MSTFAPAVATQIQWHSYGDGMARGKFENKKVFIHFYADWCVYCKEMEQTTFADPAVIAALNNEFIPIRVNTEQDRETSVLFRVRGLPDTWFLAEDGEIIGHRPGFISADELKKIFKVILIQKDAQQ
jgi:thiol:disulfide interchange protein